MLSEIISVITFLDEKGIPPLTILPLVWLFILSIIMHKFKKHIDNIPTYDEVEELIIDRIESELKLINEQYKSLHDKLDAITEIRIRVDD